jgi:hypothetical protein
MSKRHLLKLGAVVPVWAVIMLAPVAAHAVVPPIAYSNGVALGLEKHCNNEALSELSQCPNATERNELRSRKEPLVAFGFITLHTTEFAEAIHCDNTYNAEVYNERERGLATEPVRAYGVVEGWGTAVCVGKEITEFYSKEPIGEEAIAKEGPLTIFASAEDPLIIENTEAIVCEANAHYATPEECEAHNEAHSIKTQPNNFRRRKASLPWKVEVVHGKTSTGEEVSAERVGLAEFGECGPGIGEGTPTCGTGESSTEKTPSKCYPAGGKKFQLVPQGCINVNIVIPQIPEELPFFGSQEISGHNGAKSGLFPSTIVFEKGHSGYLESQGGNTGVGYNEGDLDEIGEGSIQLLTAK